MPADFAIHCEQAGYVNAPHQVHVAGRVFDSFAQARNIATVELESPALVGSVADSLFAGHQFELVGGSGCGFT
jgi:hypothetical protein